MTNEEMLLRAILGESLPEDEEFHPQNNEQAYLAYAVGLTTDPELLPDPRTNTEALLLQLALNGSGGFEITDATSLFAYDSRLENISDIFPLIKNCTSYMNCFMECTKLTSFNEKLSCADGGADTTRMFSGCSNLAGIVDLDHAPLRTQERMFYGCTSLEGILNVNLVGSPLYQFALQGTASSKRPLHRFTFSPMSRYVVNVNVAYCSFTREDALETFNSLPVSEFGSTITMTGNPCCETLTEADMAIATSKGWNVVVA